MAYGQLATPISSPTEVGRKAFVPYTADYYFFELGDVGDGK